jgi:hypothetical protein
VVVALELLLDELVEALEPPEPLAEPELHAAASPATIVSGTPHPKILVEKAIIRSSETCVGAQEAPCDPDRPTTTRRRGFRCCGDSNRLCEHA